MAWLLTLKPFSGSKAPPTTNATSVEAARAKKYLPPFLMDPEVVQALFSFSSTKPLDLSFAEEMSTRLKGVGEALTKSKSPGAEHPGMIKI